MRSTSSVSSDEEEDYRHRLKSILDLNLPIRDFKGSTLSNSRQFTASKIKISVDHNYKYFSDFASKVFCRNFKQNEEMNVDLRNNVCKYNVKMEKKKKKFKFSVVKIIAEQGPLPTEINKGELTLIDEYIWLIKSNLDSNSQTEVEISVYQKSK